MKIKFTSEKSYIETITSESAVIFCDLTDDNFHNIWLHTPKKLVLSKGNITAKFLVTGVSIIEDDNAQRICVNIKPERR